MENTCKMDYYMYMKVIANIHANIHVFTSFGAKVDFSRRPRKSPKSTIVTIFL